MPSLHFVQRWGNVLPEDDWDVEEVELRPHALLAGAAATGETSNLVLLGVVGGKTEAGRKMAGRQRREAVESCRLASGREADPSYSSSILKIPFDCV
jgi:hypothetical protein